MDAKTKAKYRKQILETRHFDGRAYALKTARVNGNGFDCEYVFNHPTCSLRGISVDIYLKIENDILIQSELEYQ